MILTLNIFHHPLSFGYLDIIQISLIAHLALLSLLWAVSPYKHQLTMKTTVIVIMVWELIVNHWLWCLFVDALGFRYVHQEPCGYISQPCSLVHNVQTVVWLHWVHAVYVLPWGEIQIVPTCCKYRPMLGFVFCETYYCDVKWPDH